MSKIKNRLFDEIEATSYDELMDYLEDDTDMMSLEELEELDRLLQEVEDTYEGKEDSKNDH